MIPSKRIGMEIILRALAISAVVFNHAHVYEGAQSVPHRYAGGMTVLLMLSGVSFARYALTTGSAEKIREAAFNLCKLLALPSIALVIFSFFYMNQFSLTELLLISNWFYGDYIARFPLWYPEIMVQMLPFVALLFSIPPFLKMFQRYPLATSITILAGAVLIRFLLPMWHDTSGLYHRLPHLFLWNFVLGWVVYYVSAGDQPIALKIVVIAAALASGIVGWDPGGMQGWWLALAVGLMLLLPNVRLPNPLVQPVTLVSQASFAIFLLHAIGLGAYRVIFPWDVPEIAFLFAMVGCVVFWILLTSFLRAWRETRKSFATGGKAAAQAL